MSTGAGFFETGSAESAADAAEGVNTVDAPPEFPAGGPAPVPAESDSGQVNREERPVSAEAIPLSASSYIEPDTVAEAGTETGFVRPYAITGGRTRANRKLEMETLVSTCTDETTEEPEQVEQRSIVQECRNPRSVAEIASTLGVPLGVARVLISDAADAGLVTVHKTISGDEGAEEHLLLMERVLSGLRRL